MKALQKEIAWTEKQFFLVECKKLSIEKNRVEKLHKQLHEELTGLEGLEKKIHNALSKKALSKVKLELRAEINRVRRLTLLLKENEKHLKYHFAHDKQQIIQREREKVSLIRMGIVVI